MSANLVHLAPALIDHLWQSTVVALLALLLLAAFRPVLSARARGILAWIALLKFAIPSALLVPQLHAPALFRQGGQVIFANRLGAASDNTDTAAGRVALRDGRPGKGPALCLALWGIGAASVMLLALWRARGDQPRADPSHDSVKFSALARTLQRISPGAGLRTPPAILIVPATEGPAIRGIVRPQLLVPAGLEESLSPAELRAVLLHELAHVRRRDNLWATLRLPFLAVFWFHPVVWILSRRIELEAEMACDEVVLAHGVESQAYVAALAKTVRHCVGLLPSTAAGAGTSPLGQRLEAILAHRGPHSWRQRAAAVPLLAAFTAMFAWSSYAGSVTSPLPSAGGPAFAQGNGRIASGDPASIAKPLVLRLVPPPNDPMEPAPLDRPAPSYPEILRRAGVSGQVTIAFTVGTNGYVHDPILESSDAPEFSDAAIEAVLTWRYRPAHDAGQPIESLLRERITFTAQALPAGVAPQARPVDISVQPL